MNQDVLTNALKMLGELLASRGLRFDLVVIGGGALLLQELIQRPTLDLDAVARVESDKWLSATPLPPALVEAVREVGVALGLPHEPRDEKDWLNSGPSILLKLGLPKGFEKRARVRHYGGLTIRIASREDLVTLKLWSATTARRGQRQKVDIQDLKEMKPTRDEIQKGVAWCAQKDGRQDFVEFEAAPVLRALGFTLSEIFDA